MNSTEMLFYHPELDVIAELYSIANVSALVVGIPYESPPFPEVKWADWNTENPLSNGWEYIGGV